MEGRGGSGSSNQKERSKGREGRERKQEGETPPLGELFSITIRTYTATVAAAR